MSKIEYVGKDALQQNIEETKEYVDNHGGHKVINSSGTQMTARAGMQFSNMSVSDDSTNNKTVIRQTQVVATKAEWDAMTPDPNVTYYLPWMEMSAIFRNGEYYGTNNQINDNQVSVNTTWSSNKINNEINTKVNTSDIANNVTTTTAGKVLDARQGKVLQDGIDTKVNKSDIANNTTTIVEGKVLDARRGKALQDSKTDNSVIAPVENKMAASQAYAAGAHFIRDGAFCTAKTAIAQGETFTLNTNYTAGSIASEFGTYSEVLGTPVASFQGNAATSSSYGNYGCLIYKCGNIEQISAYGQLSNPVAGTNGILFNLPVGYRPKHELYMQGYGTYNNVTKMVGYVIDTAGNIKTMSGSSTYTGFINIEATIILN